MLFACRLDKARLCGEAASCDVASAKSRSETDRATARARCDNLHPDEAHRDLFFSSIWNSGEADMLTDQLSETTSLILSRPERSGCGNGLPNPVTGAHGLAVKREFVQPC